MPTTALLIGPAADLARLEQQLDLLPDRPITLGWVLPDDQSAAADAPVSGHLRELEAVIARRRPEVAIVSMPAVFGRLVTSVRTRLRRLGIPDRFFPTLDDQLADIEALGDAELRAFSRRIRSMEDVGRAVAECDAFLLRRLAASRPQRLGAELVAVIESGAVQNVKGLAERAGFSERQLRRIFHREVGATPKALVRITRVRAAAAMIRGTDEALTEVAHHHGYFDQAHFVRDFRSMVGVTPGVYRRQPRALVALFE